jgi:hypothetical protein
MLVPATSTKHSVSERLPNRLCNVAILYFRETTVNAWLFTLASPSVGCAEHVAAADATNKACIYNTT